MKTTRSTASAIKVCCGALVASATRLSSRIKPLIASLAWTVHALLWHEHDGPLCGLAAHGEQADEGKTSGYQAGVEPDDARAGGARRSVVETGGQRLYRYHAVPGN